MAFIMIFDTPFRVVLLKLRYHLSQLLQPRMAPIALPESGEGDEQGPVFIIGCFRSGTSLLRRILDSHSALACPPESKFVAHSLRMLEDEESLEGLRSMGFTREAVFAATREHVARYFRAYAQAKGKRRWADKTPDYVEHIDTLDRLFDGRARMVFIYRHGLDVATSLHRRHFPKPAAFVQAHAPDDPFTGLALFWQEQARLMRRSAVWRDGRAFEVRYEDLVARPAEVLPPLFEFLGLPFEAAVLRFHELPHDKGIEDGVVTVTKGFKPSTGNYRELDPGLRARAAAAIAPTLRELGYEAD